MRSLPFVVIDLETGGLHPARNPILQIGAVDLRGSEPREYFAEVRAFAGAQIQPEALAVNGIPFQECFALNRRQESEVVPDFLRWLGPDDFLFANINPNFDRDFLKTACIRVSANLDQRMWLPARRTVDLHSLVVAHVIRSGRSIAPSGLQSDSLFRELGLDAEVKPHHALNGARHAALALQMLLAPTS